MEHLTVWEHSRDYGGYSPDGEYVITSQHRDSDALERSNYARILEDLSKLAAEHGAPDSVYDWRAGHWAVGWVEYIMVKPDAPSAVLQAAVEIVCALEDYPVYDESDWSELEYTEACDYWVCMSVADRVDAIHHSHSRASIFSARRDDLPSDDGHLFEYLTRS